MDSLALDFINTSWFITHYLFRDTLAEPELLLTFLQKRQLDPAPPHTPEDLQALRELRTFLTGALEELVAEQDITGKTAAELNKYLSMSAGVRTACFQEGKYTVSFQPVQKDWKWIMAEVTASFTELLSLDVGRLRICENPECRWFFYDETRSRTKRCCDETCASLVKVRRFRARKKEEQTEEV